MKSPAYETETCSRCNGSGHYSYNQMTGTRCFKCHGNTVVYTKRGSAAVKFAEELRSLPVSEISVGDRIYWGKGGRITVTAISEPHESGVSVVRDGKWVPCMQITLTGKTLTRAFNIDDTVRRGWTQDMVDQVERFQTNLTKAGKPRKKAIA